MIGTRNKLSSI